MTENQRLKATGVREHIKVKSFWIAVSLGFALGLEKVKDWG